MIFELQSVLDLRRDAESSAQRALRSAVADVQRVEEEQARLDARWRAACANLERETRRLASGQRPATAAQGQAREGYLLRLRDEVGRLDAAADQHRTSALSTARAAHAAALAKYEKAARERQLVSRLEERACADATRAAARREADRAGDLSRRR